MKTYPLSQSQLGVYLDYIQHPELMQYNLPCHFPFSRNIDTEKLKQAVKSVVETYPVFYTRIITQNGELRQYPDYSLQIDIPVVHVPEEEVEQRITQFIRPFDLQKDALSRFLLIETPVSLHLLFDMHHTITDGLSYKVIPRLIDMAYNGQALPEELVSLYAYAEQEELTLQTLQYEQAAIYYKEKFSDVEMARLPPINNEVGYVIKRSTFVHKQLIDDFCTKQGVPPNLLFMAAFEIVVSRINRETSVAYSTINHGRNDKKLRETVGMFVKTVPILMRIDEAQPVIDFIKSHKQELMSTIRHGVYPFTHLCQQLEIKPEIGFGFQGSAITEEFHFLGENIKAEQPIVSTLSAEKPSVVIYETNTEYEIRLRYVNSQYEDGYMERFANAMKTCIEQLAAFPEKLLKDISIVSKPEQQVLITLGKGEELVYDQTETFIDLFRKQVELHPDSTAVVDEVSSITYAELDRQSDLLAQTLVESGVGTDTFVAVMLPRRKEFLISVLSVFKAGGAYIPLDNDYPNDRLLYMLEDSAAKVLITTRALLEEKRKEGDFKADNILFVDEFDFGGSCTPINNSRPESLAYMIYTSGSTGMPKGVMVEHRGLRNFAEWLANSVDLQHGDGCAQHISFSFDASLNDLLAPLVVGAEVHILASSLRQDMEGLYRYFKKNNIIGTALSTQLGMAMLNYYDLPLRFMLAGGEKLLSVRPSSVNVFNSYGPTEFSVCSSYHVVDHSRAYDNIPIGRPVPNTISAIVDSAGNLVPRDVEGELCLIGRQIARGYWNRPELTAEKFVACPFIEGERMYRTGDLARWNEEGELEYMGRIDNQVKLRGFRIELGEIESTISRFAGIQSSVVEVKEIGAAQHLCGYYISEESIDEKEMRQYLSETLTDYMVPTAFMRLDFMPLTPNGKVDRKALPTPEIEVEEVVAPETKKEEILFEITKTILGTDKFGVTNDLDKVGLTSLSAIKFVAMAEKKGLKLKTNDVLRHKTIRKIASNDKSILFWENEYDPQKPILVFIYGLTPPISLPAIMNRLTEDYSVLVFEPLNEHYDYLFSGDDIGEIVNMYTSLLDFVLPNESKVHAFAGHCFGGEIAYRSAAKWEEMTGRQTNVYLFSLLLYRKEDKEVICLKEGMLTLTDEQKEIHEGRRKWNRIGNAIVNMESYPYYYGPSICFRALLIDDVMDCVFNVDVAALNAKNEEYLRRHMPNVKIIDVEADHYSILQEQYLDLFMKQMGEG